MLKLSDRAFKAVIKLFLKGRKEGSPSKEIEDIKNQMEILEVENTMTKI